MPIYAYRCSTCGGSFDFLQKISEPPMTDCPKCGPGTLSKQLTAAGFQLKGSGWYATDFKGGSSTKAADSKSDGDTKPAGDAKAEAPACGAGACAACS